MLGYQPNLKIVYRHAADWQVRNYVLFTLTVSLCAWMVVIQYYDINHQALECNRNNDSDHYFNSTQRNYCTMNIFG